MDSKLQQSTREYKVQSTKYKVQVQTKCINLYQSKTKKQSYRE